MNFVSEEYTSKENTLCSLCSHSVYPKRINSKKKKKKKKSYLTEEPKTFGNHKEKHRNATFLIT